MKKMKSSPIKIQSSKIKISDDSEKSEGLITEWKTYRKGCNCMSSLTEIFFFSFRSSKESVSDLYSNFIQDFSNRLYLIGGLICREDHFNLMEFLSFFFISFNFFFVFIDCENQNIFYRAIMREKFFFKVIEIQWISPFRNGLRCY